MSSTKPEVHNVLQCRQKKFFVKIGLVVFVLCEWTDKQTDRQTDMLITVLNASPEGKVMMWNVIKVKTFIKAPWEIHIWIIIDIIMNGSWDFLLWYSQPHCAMTDIECTMAVWIYTAKR